ncbi:class I SAM-dependent methyltransferase family protein [Haloarculaceae archaeon H-GB2-1]|nr:class I SAM-dependent methyltransferase family protein [Haloarculaceae archaeon H-GB1-1]MEA5388996.1 class I SAM-dependent methyltransferase family protein [Haloarculaceae archaeon H-GB11]MEA5407055.1 class I SAM-dependent methyltransferase family protein [Haloarculaceae archaeon H-GB2-1]
MSEDADGDDGRPAATDEVHSTAPDGDQHLGAVVEKPRAEVAIEQLRSEGVYDEERRVREFGSDTVALPVTEPPSETAVLNVVEVRADRRLRSLADHLADRGWTDDELDAAPGSWAVIGTVVLVDIGDAPRPEEVGEALLELHGEADTVLARGAISGAHREPDVEVVAGSGDTETVHVEHGTKYALDLADVMFSPGNKAERARMAEAVSEGERVLDMFAGIGYFTLPMARAGASVTAVERNPASFRYLVENVQLNDVTAQVQAYRADCRDVTADLSVERIVMGYYEASEPSEDGHGWRYLDHALDALESDGVVHMHEATPNGLVFERPIERLTAAAEARGRAVEILDTHRVKGYSEGVSHVVVDARVS